LGAAGGATDGAGGGAAFSVATDGASLHEGAAFCGGAFCGGAFCGGAAPLAEEELADDKTSRGTSRVFLIPEPHFNKLSRANRLLHKFLISKFPYEFAHKVFS
jgi:hypothetical protein